MRTPIIAVALAACIPAVRRSRREAAGHRRPADQAPSSGASSAGARTPSSRDFIDLNPAALLIDKRKKLSLADSTVAQLKAVEKKINAAERAVLSRRTIRHASGRCRSPHRVRLRRRSAFTAASATRRSRRTDLARRAGQDAVVAARPSRSSWPTFRERRKADVADALERRFPRRRRRRPPTCWPSRTRISTSSLAGDRSISAGDTAAGSRRRPRPDGGVDAERLATQAHARGRGRDARVRGAFRRGRRPLGPRGTDARLRLRALSERRARGGCRASGRGRARAALARATRRTCSRRSSATRIIRASRATR